MHIFRIPLESIQAVVAQDPNNQQLQQE
jgi:hypothetical protein